MRVAFIIDPMASFNPEAETTFYLMAEMTRRGWEVYGAEPKDIIADATTVRARALQLKVRRAGGRFRYDVISGDVLDLSCMDAVWLRKDPPVDINFTDHLSLLERLDDKTLLINHPTGIKRAGEKLFPLEFPGLAPPTLITRDQSAIKDFIREHKKAVLKPLNLSGGRGIIIVHAKDPSLNSFIELATAHDTKYIIVQKFVPESVQGDKRILLMDGVVLGCFLRVPGKEDFRGNLHSGAKLTKDAITARDREVIAAIVPRLRELGLPFVGFDMLGRLVTEINVTSPMGLGELNRLYGGKSEKIVVDWVERRAGG